MIAMKSAVSLILLCLFPTSAFAAGDLGGASLGVLWALPFAGMLLSIALGPVLFPHLWEHHYGKFAGFWAALTLVPLFLLRGADPALGALAGQVAIGLGVAAAISVATLAALVETIREKP